MKQQPTHTQTKLAIAGGISCIAFAITLALLIGSRLSEQALAVLAGAACGVGAAIPTSVMVIAVSNRQHNNRQQPQQQGQYPPIVVVGPQQPQIAPPGYAQMPNQGSTIEYQPQPRKFTIVGEEQE